jgi:hypothetical protein
VFVKKRKTKQHLNDKINKSKKKTTHTIGEVGAKTKHPEQLQSCFTKHEVMTS